MVELTNETIFVGKFLTTHSISVIDIGLFRLSDSSWVSFVCNFQRICPFHLSCWIFLFSAPPNLRTHPSRFQWLFHIMWPVTVHDANFPKLSQSFTKPWQVVSSFEVSQTTCQAATSLALAATGLCSLFCFSRHLQSQHGWQPSSDCFVAYGRWSWAITSFGPSQRVTQPHPKMTHTKGR